MNSFNKKIVISTTPINQKVWSKEISNTNSKDTLSTLEVKKNSENSNKILNALLNSFELGADPKNFIVSSEIFKTL